MKLIFKKTITMFFVFLFVLIYFMPYISFLDINADSFQIIGGSINVFDQENVLDDLNSSEDFILSDYPVDLSGQIKRASIINFVEWCYTYKSEKPDFALYLYFYNPQLINIVTNSLSNRIQMATKYDTVPATEESNILEYNTFPLIFCNKSTNGLFYKFRIAFTSSELSELFSKCENELRRYDFSGITLSDDSGEVKEYEISGKYIFTGYSKGYGKNPNENTLTNTYFSSVESLTLNVYSTTYRTASSSKGNGYQNDITSVYFSVPDKYIYKTVDDNGQIIKTQNGNLQKVKAQWWEYKTKPIIVTDIPELYNGLLSQVGIAKSYGENANGYGLVLGDIDVLADAFGTFHFSAAYNIPGGLSVDLGLLGERPVEPYSIFDTIYWVFPTQSMDVENGAVLVSKEILESYAKTYNKTAVNGYLPIQNGKISADLFSDSVDTGRTRGYNVKEFDASNKFNILDYDSTHSGWQKFWEYGFSKVETNDGRTDVSPIEQITKNDIDTLSAEQLASLYLINKNDASTIQSFAKNSYENNEVPYVFHFAQTDYFSLGGWGYHGDLLGNIEVPSLNQGIRGTSVQASTMTVFFDFKILTLSFLQDDVYKVIPVVQDPIDIFSDVTKQINPTPLGCNSYKTILSSLGVVIVALIIYFIATKIINFFKG